MDVKLGLWDPENVPLFSEWSCPLNRGNRYKDYMGFFPGPKFVSAEWKCPINRGVPEKRFHCIFSLKYRSLISLVNFPLYE